MNSDERFLFTYYSQLYTDTIHRINTLQDTANQIRDILDHISCVDRRSRHRHSWRHRERNIESFRETPTRQRPLPNPVLPNPVLPNPVLPNPVLPNPVLPNPVLPNPVLPNPNPILSNERITRRCLFSEIEEPLNTVCPISLERFEETTEVIQINHCRHLFRPASILSWFERSTRCPVCRYDVRGIQEDTDLHYLSQITDQLIQQIFPSHSTTLWRDAQTDASGNFIFMSSRILHP